MNRFNVAELGQALFDEAGDALFLFDPDTDQLVEVNPMAERLSGFSRRELLRMKATHLYRMEGKGGASRLGRASQQTGVFHSQEGFFLRTNQDGVWIPVNLTITRLHVQPKTLALITARDVREQREAHLLVKKMEAELRRVMASVSDCLWSAEVDEKGKWVYRYFSPVVQKIAGQPAEFFLAGLHHWWNVIHVEDRPRWRKLFASVKQDPSLHRKEEYRVFRPDGSPRWVRDSVMMSCDPEGRGVRLDGVLTDITEQRRAEEKLRESEEQLRRAVQEAPFPIMIHAEDGQVVLISRAWTELSGYEAAEIPTIADWTEKAYGHRKEVVRADIDRLYSLDARAEEGEYVITTKGGEARAWDFSSAPLGKLPNGRRLVISMAVDVTERKRAEEALRKTADQLTASNRQLQRLADELRQTAASEREAHEELKKAQSQLVQSEKLVALGQMVAGVAHEINNPLSFVINNTVVLQRDLGTLHDLHRLYQEAEGKPAEELPGVAGRIRAHAERIDLDYTVGNLDGLVTRTREGLKRIRQIVKDLRDFARLDEGDFHEADLNAGIQSTINIIQGLATKRRVTLEADLAPLPPLKCYPAKVNQVVLNLLANAIDACPEGGKVAVRSRAVADGVEVHVEDNGPGIPPDIRKRIFDPFFTTKPPGQGTGLGLSISHGIVADHGGRIDVESPPGRGAHFTVFLPLEPPAGLGRR